MIQKHYFYDMVKQKCGKAQKGTEEVSNKSNIIYHLKYKPCIIWEQAIAISREKFVKLGTTLSLIETNYYQENKCNRFSW